jgi:hypothetical protein
VRCQTRRPRSDLAAGSGTRSAVASVAETTSGFSFGDSRRSAAVLADATAFAVSGRRRRGFRPRVVRRLWQGGIRGAHPFGWAPVAAGCGERATAATRRRREGDSRGKADRRAGLPRPPRRDPLRWCVKSSGLGCVSGGCSAVTGSVLGTEARLIACSGGSDSSSRSSVLFVATVRPLSTGGRFSVIGSRFVKSGSVSGRSGRTPAGRQRAGRGPRSRLGRRLVSRVCR